MVSHLRELQHLVASGFHDSIDDPVLLVYTPRPPAGEFVFQRFWFSDTLERISLDFLYEPVDSFEYPSVSVPVKVILPGFVGELLNHQVAVPVQFPLLH